MAQIALPPPASVSAVSRMPLLDLRAAFTGPTLSGLAIAFLSVGTLLSIVTTPDHTWWRVAFSELGTFDDFSGRAFNATMLTAGLLIVLLAGRVGRDLDALQQLRGIKRSKWFGGLVASAGMHLAAVGAIPVNVNGFWHDRAASGIMLSFLGMLIVVTIRRRHHTAGILRATAAVGSVLGTTIVVFLFGVISLAALELIGFVLIFGWMSVYSAQLHRTLWLARHRAAAQSRRDRRRERPSSARDCCTGAAWGSPDRNGSAFGALLPRVTPRKSTTSGAVARTLSKSRPGWWVTMTAQSHASSSGSSGRWVRSCSGSSAT